MRGRGIACPGSDLPKAQKSFSGRERVPNISKDGCNESERVIHAGVVIHQIQGDIALCIEVTLAGKGQIGLHDRTHIRAHLSKRQITLLAY